MGKILTSEIFFDFVRREEDIIKVLIIITTL